MSSPIVDPPQASRRKFNFARLFTWFTAASFLALVAFFILEAGIFSSNIPTAGNFPKAPDVETPAQISVSRSRYEGADKQGQPYWVEAESALQDKNNSDLVRLEKVTAEMRRASGEIISVDANIADYENKQRFIDLSGDVRIASPGSYDARMQKARVTLADKSLLSEVPVAVTFASGKIDANGMKITNDGERIVFFNGVKAQFDANAQKGVTP